MYPPALCQAPPWPAGSSRLTSDMLRTSSVSLEKKTHMWLETSILPRFVSFLFITADFSPLVIWGFLLTPRHKVWEPVTCMISSKSNCLKFTTCYCSWKHLPPLYFTWVQRLNLKVTYYSPILRALRFSRLEFAVGKGWSTLMSSLPANVPEGRDAFPNWNCSRDKKSIVHS